jgi:hypothetical protein
MKTLILMLVLSFISTSCDIIPAAASLEEGLATKACDSSTGQHCY